ncbi:MAG: hypothetical protein QXG86_01030 [Candidatus Woesearchaeota archaeon]
MKLPKDVIAVTKDGKEEARILIDKGEFIRYKYRDLNTGKELKKYSILLRSDKGIDHYFLVPYKGKELVVKKFSESKTKKRKVWNEKTERIVEF